MNKHLRGLEKTPMQDGKPLVWYTNPEKFKVNQIHVPAAVQSAAIALRERWTGPGDKPTKADIYIHLARVGYLDFIDALNGNPGIALAVAPMDFTVPTGTVMTPYIPVDLHDSISEVLEVINEDRKSKDLPVIQKGLEALYCAFMRRGAKLIV
jgi:hypothetical protein